MKKLFIKLCGQVRKLRSSKHQHPLQPMKVITKASAEVIQSLYYNQDRKGYEEWRQYLNEEIKKYEPADYPHNLTPSVKNYSSFVNCNPKCITNE